MCMRSICSFLYFTCFSVCPASSLRWLCIHLYCCQFKRNEKILFCLFLHHNYRPQFFFCVTTVYYFFKKKNVRQAVSKIHYYSTKSFSLRQAHTLALWNFTTFCRREREKRKIWKLQDKKKRENKESYKCSFFKHFIVVVVLLAAPDQSCLAPCRNVARNQFLFEEAHIKYTYTHTTCSGRTIIVLFFSLAFVFLVS